MRLLRWVIVGAGLSLLGLSLATHYRIDAYYFDFVESQAASLPASNGTIRVEKFGIRETRIVKLFASRTEAESACGAGNILQWERITRTGSEDGGFSCASDMP